MVYFYCIEAVFSFEQSGVRGNIEETRKISGFHSHNEEENKAMMNPYPLKKFKEIQNDIIEFLTEKEKLDNMTSFTFTAFNNIS